MVSAQATPLEIPRAADRKEFTLVIPSQARRLSLLGVRSREAGLGSSRGWFWPDPPQKDQPVSIVLQPDSITASFLECPMPVARRAAETIARMPTGRADSTLGRPSAMTLRSCTNPLDRQP